MDETNQEEQEEKAKENGVEKTWRNEENKKKVTTETEIGELAKGGRRRVGAAWRWGGVM